MFSLSVIFIVGLCAISTQAQLDNHSIYKIMNKGDGGVLTLSSMDDSGKVKVKTWKDDAGQKWRAKRPMLDKTWEFKPTSNEKTALDADSDSAKIFARVASGANTKYWKIRDMGEGAMQIKNYETMTCLGSQGMDSPVKLMPCDNSKATQWTFVEL